MDIQASDTLWKVEGHTYWQKCLGGDKHSKTDTRNYTRFHTAVDMNQLIKISFS